MPQPTRSAARVEAKLLPAYLPKSYLSVASTRDIYVIGTPLQTEKTQHLGTGLCAVLPLCSIWAAHATWTDSFAFFFQLDQARVNCGGCRLTANNQRVWGALGPSRASVFAMTRLTPSLSPGNSSGFQQYSRTPRRCPEKAQAHQNSLEQPAIPARRNPESHALH